MSSCRTGLQSLPVETIEYIAKLARENDTKCRTGNASQLTKQGDSSSRGHTRRKSELWKADSALCLSRTCKSLADIVLPVIWKSMDFTDVPAAKHTYLASIISDGRGYQIRKLQLSIRLFPVAEDATTEGLPTRAVSTEIAIQILSSVPRLEWLEIELCSMNSPHYISKLPQTLKDALAAHSQLKHFGITCEGQSNNVTFQLDETLVADIVAGFPHLTSLTLHRVGYDALLGSSPLFNAVSSIKGLQKLDVLEVTALNELWAARPIGQHGINSLTLVCCYRLSPASLDQLLDANKTTIRSLFLAHTPNRDHPPLPHVSSDVKYDLPALRSLYVEAEHSHIDNIAYIERFSSTNLEELSLKYAAGVKTCELEALLKSKRFKNLKHVEVGRCGLANLQDQSLHKLREVGKQVGVEIAVGNKSALAPDIVM